MLREHFYQIVAGQGRSNRSADEVDMDGLENRWQGNAGCTIVAKVGSSVGFGGG